MVNTKKLIKSKSVPKDRTTYTRPEGAGNFDNMDDKNIVNQINCLVGTVENAPTDSKSIVNKKYVDDNVFSKDHDDLTNVTANQHHTKYTDAEAVSAVSTADDYLKNDGDTATGDYTFDTRTLFVDAANHRLGVGTATPVTKFDFKQATDIHLGLRDGQLDATAIQLNAYNDGGTANIPMELKSSKFIFSEAGTQVMTIDDGNVGIGTDSPDTLLELSSDTGNNYLRIKNTDTGLSQDDILGRIEFYNSDPSDYGPNVAGIIEATADGGTGGGCALDFKTKPVSEGADASSSMYINQSGNVGIGTSSPNEALTLGADGVLSINERTTAPSATTAYGKLWVKTATPNELWFTDDAGTSTKIV